MQGVQDQLDADEGQQHGQPDRQVDQALEQPADEEVELTQAHEGEDVGGEDEVGLLGEPVDRGDRVEGEEQVGRPQRHDDDEHRRHQPLGALVDEELGAVEGTRRREPSLNEL